MNSKMVRKVLGETWKVVIEHFMQGMKRNCIKCNKLFETEGKSKVVPVL
jgi:hypothetical protein